jgi:hypothetical protein
MPSTIITKNSSTASAVPGSGSLTQGELAVNVTDKKLYTKDSGGSVVTLTDSMARQASSNVTITGGSITGITDLAVADGGTGASTAANARTNLSAAASGANSDITSLTGLTTPLSQAQGGTGTTTGYYGFKNRIINGAMVIDQRNAGASVTLSTTTQYPVDRFASYEGTSGATITAQRSTIAPTGFTNSILYTVSTGTTPAVGDINAFWQSIEGFNVADLGWGTANAQTVTLSFWVRSSVTGTYSVSFNNNASNRFYVGTYTVNSANTWEQKTITVAGDTSGTWTTDNTTGIQVTWDIGYGTNFNGTAGAWGSSTIRRTSGSVQLAATTGATFYITGVQLEVGSTATSFDYRPYGTELALCQRYYAKTFPQNIAPANGLGANYYFGYSVNTTNPSTIWKFPVTMRASPTVTLFNDRVGGTVGQWNTGTLDSANARSLGSSTEFVMFDNTATVLGTTTNWWLGGATAAIEL